MRAFMGQVLAQLDRVETQRLGRAVAARHLQAGQVNVKTAGGASSKMKLTPETDSPNVRGHPSPQPGDEEGCVVSQQALDRCNRDYLSNLNKQRTGQRTPRCLLRDSGKATLPAHASTKAPAVLAVQGQAPLANRSRSENVRTSQSPASGVSSPIVHD